MFCEKIHYLLDPENGELYAYCEFCYRDPMTQQALQRWVEVDPNKPEIKKKIREQGLFYCAGCGY